VAEQAERPESLVWYVSYGSNMHGERLATYLSGGMSTTKLWSPLVAN
jgi:hypothetical protein